MHSSTLETIVSHFLHLVEHQKLMKIVHCTSINLRYFYVNIHCKFVFFNLHEKVMPLIMSLKEVCQVKQG